MCHNSMHWYADLGAKYVMYIPAQMSFLLMFYQTCCDRGSDTQNMQRLRGYLGEFRKIDLDNYCDIETKIEKVVNKKTKVLEDKEVYYRSFACPGAGRRLSPSLIPFVSINKTYIVGRYTSTLSLQLSHFNSLTSNLSLQLSHCNSLTSTLSLQLSHFNSLTSTLSLQLSHFKSQVQRCADGGCWSRCPQRDHSPRVRKCHGSSRRQRRKLEVVS